MEKRVIKAGKELCNSRIGQKGTVITADDIRALKVKTFAPAVQITYISLGVILFVFGLWVQYTFGNMATSLGLVLIGFMNIAFGVQGRPKMVSQIDGLDLMDITAEIVNSFVAEQESSREKGI